MNTKKTAMILAAGRGERMRPITDKLPKPLIEVNSKPLIVWHIEKLVNAGFEKIVINVSWLGDKIKNYLGDGSKFGASILYSEETEALETAGGIIQALPLLGNKPFVVLNGDIWTEFSEHALNENLQQLSSSKFSARLILVNNPKHNPKGDFTIKNNVLQAYKNTESSQNWTYSGISFYAPEFFSGIQQGKRALLPLWKKAAKQQQISAEIYLGYWHDVGTAERLAEITKHLEDRRI